MIDLKKTLLIVDGKSEVDGFAIKFRKEFDCVPSFRRKNINGKDVTPDGYVNVVLPTIIVALNGSFHHIICVLDREGRRVSASTLCATIKSLFVNKIVEQTKFSKVYLEEIIQVCAPDICFENWIISDVEGLKQARGLIHEAAVQRKYEGTSGVAQLKKIMTMPYNKVLHAPTLFSYISFSRGVENSVSLEKFTETLGLDSST